MKKSILLSVIGATMFAPGAMFAEEYPASASTQVYDFSPWNNEAVLELFAKAADEGRQCPTQAEFESLGLTFDLEFAKSHVRRRSLVEDDSKKLLSTARAGRRLWCNIPSGYGSVKGGYPSTSWNTDVFSMWNYTHLFGNWNHGILQAPGAWLDAAHRNGTRAYSGIKFFESWTAGSEAAGFAKFITTKNDDGSYRYVDALINASAFFGSDGINYNMEDNAYTNADWIAFHAALKKRAKERGLSDFGIGMYTQNQSLSTANASQLLGGNKENGAVYDCFLNYSNGDFAYTGVATSLNNAKNLVGSAQDVYQGVWIVNLDRRWGAMNYSTRQEMNICIWGEHDQSRFWQYTVGRDPMDKQRQYQGLLEKAFSGGTKNPLTHPTLTSTSNAAALTKMNFQVANYTQESTQMVKFPGIATLIPERTAIKGNLPFQTLFSLGNGEKYFYKGKATHTGWYNMSQQDIVPTYRWLVTKKDAMTTASTEIVPSFTHEDGYIGGSCLRLTGASASGADLVLYRTSLTVNGDVKATLALKSGVAGANASNLSLIVRKAGSTEWIAVPYGDLAGATWESKTLSVGGLANGDVIEYIGLRVEGSSADYKMHVGQLLLSDGSKTNCASLKEGSLLVEVKEESTSALSVKLNWDIDATGYTTSKDQFATIFNDEVNIDHFEVLYKEGADGRVKEVARTSQWAAYVGKLPMDQKTVAYIGVRAVSTDLQTMSPIQWVQIPRHAGALPVATEEDPYGTSYLENYGNSTRESIVKSIFWEKITSEGADQNLNYVVTSNPADTMTNYYFAKDHLLKVSQGQTVTLNLKGYNTGAGDQLKWDWVYLYMDYDGNHIFLDADETLGLVGKQNAGTDSIVDPGVSFTITIPSDAKPGTSRLRIVANDAWGAHPGPVGATWKGHSLDFPVEISGTNEARQPAKSYLDYLDKGEAEQPEGISGSSAISDVEGAQNLPTYTLDGDQMSFGNVDKAWFFDLNGRCVKFVANGELPVSVADLANGVYVIKMQTGQVIRAAKFAKN